MRHVIVIHALGLLVGCALTLSQPSGSSAGEAVQPAVRGFLSQFVDAWNAADIERLTRLFSQDATFDTPSGQARSASGIRRFLTDTKQEFFEDRRLSLSIRSIALESDDRASVEADYMLDGYAAMGFGSMPPGSITFALVHRGHRWWIERAVMRR